MTKRTDHTTKTSNGSYLVHTRNGDYEARNCGGHSCWALYAPAGNLSGYYRSLKQIIKHLLGRGIIEAAAPAASVDIFQNKTC